MNKQDLIDNIPQKGIGHTLSVLENSLVKSSHRYEDWVILKNSFVALERKIIGGLIDSTTENIDTSRIIGRTMRLINLCEQEDFTSSISEPSISEQEDFRMLPVKVRAALGLFTQEDASEILKNNKLEMERIKREIFSATDEKNETADKIMKQLKAFEKSKSQEKKLRNRIIEKLVDCLNQYHRKITKSAKEFGSLHKDISIVLLYRIQKAFSNLEESYGDLRNLVDTTQNIEESDLMVYLSERIETNKERLEKGIPTENGLRNAVRKELEADTEFKNSFLSFATEIQIVKSTVEAYIS